MSMALVRVRQRLARGAGLRVVVWYAVVFAVSAGLVGAIGYHLLVASLERRDHDLLRVKLADYAARYESGGLRALSDAVSAERASGDPDSVLVRLVGPNADVLLVSAPASWPEFQFSRLDESPAPPSEAWRTVPSASDQVNLELVSRPLFDGSLIQVGRTTMGRDRLLGDVRDLFGFLMIVVIAVGLAGGAALTHQALRPLRELRDAVGTIARTGQLTARVTAGPDGDLVDELSGLFNQMLARIQTLVDGMRGALDNVAHDLRTPIARLRARAESTLASGGGEAGARDALAACVEEADRVTALLTTLMDISEAETGTMRLALEPVPVADVARDTIDLYEDSADNRGITLTSEVPEGLRVQADRQRLRQVLANLVDNALKYTPAGGRVTIGAERATGEIAITVTDSGSGIDPNDLPRIWDRLYRGDPDHEHSLGLGLSLVRAIISAHGGRVDVSSDVGRGSTFRVSLPPAAGAPGA
jgi:signal transduction histidine kinase